MHFHFILFTPLIFSVPAKAEKGQCLISPMQLLANLPRLPFSVAFDILFRHGGFAALARIYGPMEARYQFWRMFFVSSPVGKLRPDSIGLWVEVMCACHIVQSLPHAAHAVYLLRPIRHDIPESVEAWAIAGGRGNQLLCPEILIKAMRVFIPKGHQPLLQREWFWVSDVHYRRPVNEWLMFADEVVANHLFTRNWWMQKEGPFYLLEGECSSMGMVIAAMGKQETLRLRKRLVREEVKKYMEVLRQARAKKEWKAGIGEKEKSIGKKGGEKKEKKTTPLSVANKKEVDRLTQIRYREHTSVLAQVKHSMSSMLVVTLDYNFKYVLCLVASLSHQYPHIKWSIKLAMHEAATETGRSVWDVERELQCLVKRRDTGPLAKLLAIK